MRLEGTGELRILVVDDEGPVREVLRDCLELLGAEVVTAADGDGGLAAYLRERPDAILTDIRMPGMDGFQMTARIREVDRDIPIFIISAHLEPGTTEKYAALGIAAAFSKPVKLRDLKRALEAVFDRSDVSRR
jgi:CheY-like chemotaxis protein